MCVVVSSFSAFIDGIKEGLISRSTGILRTQTAELDACKSYQKYFQALFYETYLPVNYYTF